MRGPGVTHLAGWLFADLLLVLVLIVLGGQTVQTVQGAEPATPRPSPAARTSAAPSASAPPGMDPDSRRLKLLVSQDVADDLRGSGEARDAARRRINKEVDRALAA